MSRADLYNEYAPKSYSTIIIPFIGGTGRELTIRGTRAVCQYFMKMFQHGRKHMHSDPTWDKITFRDLLTVKEVIEGEDCR